MATTVAKLMALLDADTRPFDRKMRGAESTTKKFGIAAKAALIGGATAGFYALGKAAKIGWDEFNEGQRVAAQTNAVIKSTGGVAHVSAQDVEDLGRALMLKSGIDDEVIKSGENVLLTFRKVRNEAGAGNDVFNQATKLALDLSVALGTDLQSANIQLGKALNGSSTGITALVRSGVTFSDKQREVIQHLFDTNHALEAQKMILAEVSREFGGSAAAAGKTFSGQLNIMRERLNNFLGDLTGKAIPYLERFAKWLDPRVTDAVKSVRAIMREWQATISTVSDSLGRHEKAISDVGWVIQRVINIVRAVIAVQLFWARVIRTVWTAEIRAAIAVTRALIATFKFLQGVARTVWNAVSGYILGPINRVRQLIGWVQDAIGWFKQLLGLSNSNVGSSLGSAAGTRPTGATQRTTTSPRLAVAGVGDIHVNLNVDGEVFHRVIRRREQQWTNRGGL